MKLATKSGYPFAKQTSWLHWRLMRSCFSKVAECLMCRLEMLSEDTE